jgi:hypothetical protein
MATITRLARATKLVKFYEAHKGDEKYEPNWIHPAFEVGYKIVDDPYYVDSDKGFILDGCYESITLPDGYVCEAFPGLTDSPKRIMEDGFKVGTTSWIFMGRKNPAYQAVYRDWVILGRKWAKDGAITYMAYHPDKPMGLSAMTGEDIGPTFDLAQIKAAIDEMLQGVY